LNFGIGELMMADFVDLEKIFPNGVFHVDEKHPEKSLDELILKLCNAPVIDAVEVVRCKDCKHFCPYEGEEHKGDCAELVGLESCVYEDDFCSYGERRVEK
jgi:Pyruvate/2-oxoacid:ferredoxin oxidoreductase delta subunit